MWPSVHEWTEKLWSMHATGYFSAIKKNKILLLMCCWRGTGWYWRWHWRAWYSMNKPDTEI